MEEQIRFSFDETWISSFQAKLIKKFPQIRLETVVIRLHKKIRKFSSENLLKTDSILFFTILIPYLSQMFPVIQPTSTHPIIFSSITPKY